MAKKTASPDELIIMVCTGSHCADKKSEKLRSRLKDLLKDRHLDMPVRCKKGSCVKACGKGPIVEIFPGETRFEHVKPKDAEKVLAKVLALGKKSTEEE